MSPSCHWIQGSPPRCGLRAAKARAPRLKTVILRPKSWRLFNYIGQFQQPGTEDARAARDEKVLSAEGGEPVGAPGQHGRGVGLNKGDGAIHGCEGFGPGAPVPWRLRG